MSLALLKPDAKVEIKLGDYRTASASDLVDPATLAKAQEYRRLASGRMQPIERRDIPKRLSESDYHVSRKVDGEFCVVAFDGREACVVNPGGLVRLGAPCMAEAASLLGKAGVKQALLAAEIHVERADGKRSRHHDVARAARTPESAADLDSLRLAVFDGIEWEGRPLAGEPFAGTWRRITETFGAGKLCAPVEAVRARTASEVEARFEQWVVREGAEGIVVRSDAVGSFKVKPRHTIDAAVVGFTEGLDDRKGMIHDLLVALMRKDGTFQVLGRVGGGYSDDERRAFVSDLADMAVESDYAEVSPDHLAYQMVRPEWIIELSCLDLVSQTTRGAPIDRMVLGYHGASAARYEAIRRLPLASVISPNFIRRRDDKAARPDEISVRQVVEHVEVPLLEKDARQLALPRSEVVRREAFTKAMKGQTMVRKLFLWKTNKEAMDASFPAYVLHFTDWSPNRKTPLERDMRVSSSRAQIEALYAEMKQENIVKGWAPAPPSAAPAG